MSGPTIGSLFAGYDGIALGVQEVMPDARVAWVSDVCKFDKDGNASHFEPHRAPCSILAHHYPDVPNLGDITAVDWVNVEPVDIITGGSPCQDLSHAGKRAGMKAGTRSGLWASMCDAIDILRPSLVIWENVRGALSAEATIGEVESCEFCMADRVGQPMRALGRVLGDLAELGYDAAWVGLRAADVGAAHGRFRVFVLAWPADAAFIGREWEWVTRSGWAGLADGSRGAVALLPTATAQDSASSGGREGSSNITLTDAMVRGRSLPTPRATDGTKGGPNQRGSSGDLMLPSAVMHLLPSPQTSDTNGAGEKPGEWAGRWQLRDIALDRVQQEHGMLLPTPAVNDMGAGKTVEDWDNWTERMQAKHGNGNGHGKSLSIETQRLLPTPAASEPGYQGDAVDADGSPVTHASHRWYDAQTGRLIQKGLTQVASADLFGQYAPAIARWEAVLGRPAPSPTEPTGKNDAMRLSPKFVEWMMGLPDGWVTDVPGITRNQALKALGNGVVPQQCAEAVRYLLGVRATALVGAA